MTRQSFLLRRAASCALPLLAACSSGASDESASPDPPPVPLAAFESPALSAAAIETHVSVLAHDSMQGRGTGAAGGERAARYLEAAFRRAGLRPPGTTGSYRQDVPLLATRVDTSSIHATLSTVGELDPGQVTVFTARDGGVVSVDGPMVLAGHGVVAPELGLDDFAGLAIDGAFVAVRPGLPPEAVASIPGGTNSYIASDAAKAAEARRRGALGIVFLTTSAESYSGGRRFVAGFDHLSPRWGAAHEPDVSIVLGPDASRVVAESESATLSLSFAQTARAIDAPNIVGVVEGEGDEAVVVTAHYDAYGLGPPDAEGDSIYNGATDNAAGTAGIVELARWLAAREERPTRTVVFVATTAEERGLLGMRYYTEHPLVPLSRTVVNVNVDGLGFSAPTDGFTVFPVSGTDIVPTLEGIAGLSGMSFAPQEWHEGMHFSFDTTEFLARGIVGFTVWQDGPVREPYREQPRGSGGPIHTPDDEFHLDWIDDGIEQHLTLYRDILAHYADGGTPPRFTADHRFGPAARARGAGR